MKSMTIAEAVGYKLADTEGGYIILSRYHPYRKEFYWNGYNAKYKDPCAGSISCDEIEKKYGVKIEPSSAELEVIERARLTRQVELKANELRVALENWLNNEKAR